MSAFPKFAVCGVHEALTALAEGAVMLTAQHSQAAHWLQRFTDKVAGGVCAAPSVYRWQDWLQMQAARLPDAPVPLNRLQELYLWERIIAADCPDLPETALRGLAEHARQAWLLMQAHDIGQDELCWHGDEAEALLRWIKAMAQQRQQPLLAERTLIASLPDLLLRHGPAFCPARMLLVGFSHYTPQQQRLLAGLQDAGTLISVVQPQTDKAALQVRAYADEQQEYQHVARAVGDILALHAEARIAVVVPEQADMAMLGRVFDRVLLPESRWQLQPSVQAVAMTTETLADTPMIRQVLHVLSLAGQRLLTFDDCSRLLFLPWLTGQEQEWRARAELDRRLRRDNRHQLSYRELLYLSRQPELSAWHACIRQLAAWQSRARRVSSWVQDTHSLLQGLGLMQQAGNSASDTHMINAFRDVLLSLAAMEAVADRMSWSRFLSWLRSACSRISLPRPAVYAAVQVLPLAHLSGMAFDYVFVTGMDEERFPPSFRPHPLLPVSVQRTHGLPGSSAALCYAEARSLWQQVQHSAPGVMCSFAVQREEKALLPSPMLAAWPCERVAAEQETITPWPQQAYEHAPAVPLQTAEMMRGGTAILRNQSACPFRAFATHRLGIAALEDTQAGITPGSKGSLIHRALEYIWRRLKGRQALARMDEAEREQLVSEAVDAAWQQQPLAVEVHVRACEQKRMRQVLMDWLELELTRPDFTVTATEQRFELSLPEHGERKFCVTIMADRMDEDAASHRILLDYKTGQPQSPAQWQGERMEEPQLPQYALAARLGEHDAVAFARVRRGDSGFEGLSGEDTGIAGIAVCDGKRGRPQSWQAILQEWQQQIQQLAMEVADGRCDVSPRNAQACRYCGLEAVCRIGDIGLDGEEA